GKPSPEAQVTAPNKTKRKPRKRVTKAPLQTREEQPTAASQGALPPVEAAAVPSPEPVEAPAPAAAVERTACRACGSPVFNPKEERCWHCGGYVDVPDESALRPTRKWPDPQRLA